MTPNINIRKLKKVQEFNVEWNGKTILVIDDFSNFRTVLRKILESFGVRCIDDASNGQEAIKKIAARKYDIILCDYNLGSNKDGQQILEEAKHKGFINYSSIFMMVTAENAMQMVIGAVEYQPDDYLIKPFTRELLKSRLEKLIEKKKSLEDVSRKIEMKEYHSAIAVCEKHILNDHKMKFEFLRIKADLLILLGKYEQAAEVYAGMLNVYSVPWAIFGLGKATYFLKHYEQARDIFQELVGKHSTFMEAYDWLAKTHESLGDLEQAQKVLMAATGISPKVVQRHRKLGEVAHKNKDHIVATNSFRAAIREGKHSCFKSASEYTGLAKVLVETKSPDEALRVINDSRKEFKDDPQASLQTVLAEGLIYHALDRMDDAKKSLEEADGLYSRFPCTISPDGTIEMARTYFALGEKDKGIRLMQDLVRNHHEDDHLIEKVGEVFKDASLQDEGSRMIDLTRKEVVRLNNDGVRLVRDGKLTEAIEYFEKAAAAMPGNRTISANTVYALVVHMQQSGRDEQLLSRARRYLAHVKGNDPSGKVYQKVLSLYRNLTGEI